MVPAMTSLLDRPVFLGAGVMGGRLARRLASKGFPTALWNRSSRAAELIAGDDLRAIVDLREALTGATFVLACVADDEAVLGVLTGDHVEALPAGTLVVDCSSTLPATARTLAASLADRKLRFVDAPISGGPEAAEAGSLTFLCGGSEHDVDDARTVLSHLGSGIAHVGGHGAGQMAKLISQVVMSGALLGAAEGIGLARAAGVDGQALIDALVPGAAGSWVLENRAPFMVHDSYPRGGAMALHRKDLDNVLRVAEEVGVDLPGVRLVRSIETALEEQGYGHENVAAIGRAYAPAIAAEHAQRPPESSP